MYGKSDVHVRLRTTLVENLMPVTRDTCMSHGETKVWAKLFHTHFEWVRKRNLIVGEYYKVFPRVFCLLSLGLRGLTPSTKITGFLTKRYVTSMKHHVFVAILQSYDANISNLKNTFFSSAEIRCIFWIYYLLWWKKFNFLRSLVVWMK